MLISRSRPNTQFTLDQAIALGRRKSRKSAKQTVLTNVLLVVANDFALHTVMLHPSHDQNQRVDLVVPSHNSDRMRQQMLTISQNTPAFARNASANMLQITINILLLTNSKLVGRTSIRNREIWAHLVHTTYVLKTLGFARRLDRSSHTKILGAVDVKGCND